MPNYTTLTGNPAKGAVPPGEYNVLETLKGEYEALVGYTFDIPDWALLNAANYGITTLSDFGGYMIQVRNFLNGKGMGNDSPTDQAWADHGLTKDEYVSASEIYSTTFKELTGQDISAAQLAQAFRNPRDPTGGLLTGSQYRQQLISDSALQDKYQWLRFGMNYQQWQAQQIDLHTGYAATYKELTGQDISDADLAKAFINPFDPKGPPLTTAQYRQLLLNDGDLQDKYPWLKQGQTYLQYAAEKLDLKTAYSAIYRELTGQDASADLIANAFKNPFDPKGPPLTAAQFRERTLNDPTLQDKYPWLKQGLTYLQSTAQKLDLRNTYATIYTQLTGKNLSLEQLDAALVNPLDAKAPPQTGEEYRQRLLNDTVLQKNFGWVKYGLDYAAWTQEKLSLRTAYGRDVSDAEAASILQYHKAATGPSLAAKAGGGGQREPQGTAGVGGSVAR